MGTLLWREILLIGWNAGSGCVGLTSAEAISLGIAELEMLLRMLLTVLAASGMLEASTGPGPRGSEVMAARGVLPVVVVGRTSVVTVVVQVLWQLLGS